MENREEKKLDFYNAITWWNRVGRGKKWKISFSWVAVQLGISRQALQQLSKCGGKKGLVKYRDKLQEILPDELFAVIDFPEHFSMKKFYGKNEKVCFDVVEKERLKEVSWVVGKNLYEKIMTDKGITEYMKEKVIGKIEEAEEWLKTKNNINSKDGINA